MAKRILSISYDESLLFTPQLLFARSFLMRLHSEPGSSGLSAEV